LELRPPVVTVAVKIRFSFPVTTMTVRAFVGHSFLDKDKEVVRAFTDYLDTLKRSLPDFDWEHATEPKPGGVPTKVLELINGKNLFIGICTKNERVSKDENYSKAFLGSDLKVSQSKLDWKTSDWIIQEIGLAIGRGLKLILLLENGVRKPGGLFGDLEYILFDSDKPADSFQSLTSMISNVSNEPSKQVKSSAGKTDPNPESKTSAVDSQETERKKPSADWVLHDYLLEHHFGLLEGDDARCEEIEKAYFDSVGGAESPAGIGWQARVLYNRIRWAKGGDLKEMSALVESNSNNSEVLTYAARAYQHYKDNSVARDLFEKAAKFQRDVSKKIYLLCQAVELRENIDDVALIEEIKELISSDELEADALSNLSELNEYYDSEVYKLAMLERRIQLEPSDTRIRFQLAYLHAEENNSALALYHYLQIPENERSSMAWNNLGVSFGEFSLSTKSTDAYQKAVDGGETLAMSNLAQIYMKSGFYTEAQKLLSNAIKSQDCHDNVASSQVDLNELHETEEEKLKETISSSPDDSAFFASVGHALWQPEIMNLAQKWKCKNFQLEVDVTGKDFVARGTEVVKSTGLAAALYSNRQGSISTSYTLTYSGKIRGRTVVGTRIRVNSDSATRSTLIGSIDDTESFVILISADGQTARCQENEKEIRFQLSH
jgi:tetratricopeptide (TPR) repeat protein